MQTGHSTVDTTAKALDATGFLARQYIEIKADSNNSDSIYVGVSAGVSAANGYRLGAGERLQIPIQSTAQVFVVGGDSAQGYSFLVN